MVTYLPTQLSRGDGVTAQAPQLSTTGRRWWIAAGAASAVVLTAALYYKRCGRWPGQGPLVPPDNPSGDDLDGPPPPELVQAAAEAVAAAEADYAAEEAAAAAAAAAAESEAGEQNGGQQPAGPSAAAPEASEEQQSEDVPKLSQKQNGEQYVVSKFSSLHESGVRVADSKLYAWSQSPVELIVESSKKFLKRSEVHVVMKPNHLRFSLDGLSIIDGKLREPIHPSESTWQIEDCKGGESRVVLTLTKAASDVLWPSVVI